MTFKIIHAITEWKWPSMSHVGTLSSADLIAYSCVCEAACCNLIKGGILLIQIRTKGTSAQFISHLHCASNFASIISLYAFLHKRLPYVYIYATRKCTAFLKFAVLCQFFPTQGHLIHNSTFLYSYNIFCMNNALEFKYPLQ